MILTTAEAAEQTGKNERSIRRMCEDGTLSAMKLGRFWLIDANDVMRDAHGQTSTKPCETWR